MCCCEPGSQIAQQWNLEQRDDEKTHSAEVILAAYGESWLPPIRLHLSTKLGGVSSTILEHNHTQLAPPIPERTSPLVLLALASDDSIASSKLSFLSVALPRFSWSRVKSSTRDFESASTRPLPEAIFVRV